MFEPALRPPLTYAAAIWLPFSGPRLLVDARGELLRGSASTLGRSLAQPVHYLGALDGVPCFTGPLDPTSTSPAGAELQSLRQLITRLSREDFELVGRAAQILEWERTHAFCGACAAPTEHVEGSRSRRCPRCTLVFFPRLNPAIIVAVTRGDELLMARTHGTPPGIYALVAGFVEPGETLEQTVAREVMEETGIAVENVRYHGSQPWPFPSSLMIGFTADYQGGELRVDHEELEDARFFRADAMPAMFPGRVSISQWLIADFLRRHGHELP